MNLLALFNQFEGLADQENLTRTSSRREAFSSIGKIMGKTAAIGLPLGAALLAPTPVRAQGGGTSVVDVLNFALLLEYLEAEYYVTGLSSNNLLSGDIRQKIILISQHETSHVELLKSAISSSGGTPITSPTFDFTAGGTFNDVFSNMQTFLAVAQAFEDTGVRAYKGQAANLMSSDSALTTALQIHSVEARHASEIRRIRGSKGWITNATNTSAPAADAVYAGEDNIIQLGVDAAALTTVSRDRVTEAYDEPLTMAEVNAIAGLFIV